MQALHEGAVLVMERDIRPLAARPFSHLAPRVNPLPHAAGRAGALCYRPSAVVNLGWQGRELQRQGELARQVAAHRPLTTLVDRG